MLRPSHLIKILKISQDSFPCDLEFPFVLSRTYTYVLFHIGSVDVYLIENNLEYTVQVLLVMHSVFNVFSLMLFPIQVEGMEKGDLH